MKNYSRRVVRFYSNKLNLLLLIPIILFIVASVFFRYFLEDQSQASLKEQTLLRQQVITRSGAKSITSFLELLSHSLVLLASDLDLQGEKQEDLNAFAVEWEGTPVWGVIYVDENGLRQTVSTSNFEMIEINVNIANTEVFEWSKTATEGEVYIGEPWIPRGVKNPQPVIPVLTPVVRDGQIKGFIGVPVVISQLANEYLDPLKISEETRIYLINNKGVIIYSSLEQLTGQDYLEVLKEKQFPEKERADSLLRQALQSGEEGKMDILLPNEKTGELTRFLIAYNSIRRNGEHYVLAVATPVEDALAFHQPYRILKKVSFFIVFLSIIGFSAFIVIAVRIAKRDAYFDGFNHGKNHNEKKK